MARIAVLQSHHEVVATVAADKLEWVYCMAGNLCAEDLLKVVDVAGNVYWCDSIEFVNLT